METKTGKSWLNQCDYEKAVIVLVKAKEDVNCLHEIVEPQKQDIQTGLKEVSLKHIKKIFL